MNPRERKLFVILTILAIVCGLPGCATCERHPVACSVAGVVVVGAITYSLTRHHSPQTEHTDPFPGRPPCGAGAC